MGRGDEVDLGRKLVGFGGETFHEPAAGQPGILAVGRELGETVLESREVGLGEAQRLAQLVGLVDVCLERMQRVDVVECAQLIEPQDVAMHELRALDEVAYQATAASGIWMP